VKVQRLAPAGCKQGSKFKIQRFLTCLLPLTGEASVLLLITGYWLLTTASLALGAEEGTEGGSDLLWRIINFTILVVLLYLLLAKRVKEFLTTRREAIKTALEEARKAREEAERKYREYEERLAILDKRIGKIFSELRAEGEIEKERIVEEAKKAAERIKEQSRLTVAQEVKKAKEGIKEEVARLVIEMAEEILRREIQHSDQERLIQEYLEKIRLH